MDTIGWQGDGFYIPQRILDIPQLTFQEKIVFCEIKNLNNKKQKVTIEHIAGILNVTKARASIVLKTLSEKGFLTKETISDYKILKQMTIDRTNGNKVCEWCKCTTTSLHNHHYPKPKSQGGKKTVSICPNCHQHFHDLQRENIFAKYV